MEPLVTLRGLGKRYDTPPGAPPALTGVDLDVGRGEFVAVRGKSGSGKSTLLHLVGGIDRPSEGTVVVGGRDLGRASEDELARWRARTVGIVFQFFQLLPTLTVAENVILAMDFASARPGRERRPHALALLERVAIREHADKLPHALSGGQQQRAAIARALANDPPLLIADEPTGNLDSVTARAVLDLLREVASGGTAVLMATHEPDAPGVFDRQLQLVDGRLAGAVDAAN
jgi:putative ABC transport system ATP-binding protein